MNKYNIFFSANNGFSQHLCVCLFSMLDNIPKNKKINIYILNEDISEKNKQKINNSLKKFDNKKIQFVNTKEYIEKHRKNLNISSYDISAYNRLFIPEIFPNIDIGLYLDCDTIFNGDITTIRENDLKDKPIGGVLEPIGVKYYDEILKIGSKIGYFNSGLLYMNLKQIREKKLFQKVLEYINHNKKNILFADQDGLNTIFADNRLKLPAKYNVQITVSLSKSYKDTFYSKSEYNESIKSPIMIHFNGNLKPRKGNCFYNGSELYKKYLNQTEYKNFKIKKDIKSFILFNIKKYIINSLPNFLYQGIIKIWRSFL